MTTRTLIASRSSRPSRPSRPFRTALASALAARGVELRLLVLVVLATLLLCGALLPIGHDAAVAQETAASAARGPLPSYGETPARSPMWVALESWGEPHGLR